MSGLDLDAIDLRVAAATPSPWTFHNGELWCRVTAEQLDAYDESRGEDEELWPKGADTVFHGDVKRIADAAFIAHARQDVPALVAAIRAVLAQHSPEPAPPAFYKDDRQRCSEDHQQWPCQTVKALS